MTTSPRRGDGMTTSGAGGGVARAEEHRYLDPETFTAATGLGLPGRHRSGGDVRDARALRPGARRPRVLGAGVAVRHPVRRLVLLPVLLVLLAGCGVTEPPAPSPSSAAAPLPGARSGPPPTTTTPAGPAPVVVLDPGHNGGNATAAEEIAREVPDGRGGTKPCNTTGTETADGYAEHAFAFDVAARVTRLLTAQGVVVRSTRDSDDGVGPCVHRRAALANDAGAALSVSIHADSGPAGGRGFHVALADPPLAPSQRAPSAALGEALVAGLEAQGFTPSTYRGEDGVDPRPDLAGLNHARVPAALVECASMADPGEARVVEDPAGRRRYAEGIAAGILRALGR